MHKPGSSSRNYFCRFGGPPKSQNDFYHIFIKVNRPRPTPTTVASLRAAGRSRCPSCALNSGHGRDDQRGQGDFFFVDFQALTAWQIEDSAFPHRKSSLGSRARTAFPSVPRGPTIRLCDCLTAVWTLPASVLANAFGSALYSARRNVPRGRRRAKRTLFRGPPLLCQQGLLGFP